MTPAPTPLPSPAFGGKVVGNSIGMKFVPVKDILFCIWPTRVSDYQAFIQDSGYKSTAWLQPGFKQGPDHPVVNVSWTDAVNFCRWLTERERKAGTIASDKYYRLPTDLEWSEAEDKDPPVMLRVADTGELEIPGVGLRVKVTGKTAAQAAAEIKRQLESDYYYTATVRLGLDTVNRAASIGRVYVSGLVRQPGPQPFYSDEKITASSAILRAGGFAQFADMRKVKVTRKGGGGSQSYTIDLKAVLEEGQIDKDMELHDGDYVNVPQRRFNW